MKKFLSSLIFSLLFSATAFAQCSSVPLNFGVTGFDIRSLTCGDLKVRFAVEPIMSTLDRRIDVLGIPVDVPTVTWLAEVEGLAVRTEIISLGNGFEVRECQDGSFKFVSERENLVLENCAAERFGSQEGFFRPF